MMRLVLVLLPAAIAVTGCQKNPKATEAEPDHPAGEATAKGQASAANQSQLAEASLHIEGMVCQGCAEGAKSCLTGIDGVVRADVSLDDRTARVQYDPSRTDPEQMVAELEALDRGSAPAFEATLQDPEPK